MRTLQATHAPGCGCSAHAAQPDAPPLAADLQTERMAAESAPAWAEIMDAIKPIVDNADSLPALRDALLGAFGTLPTAKLAEVMAMGFAAADLAGRFDAHTDSDAGNA